MYCTLVVRTRDINDYAFVSESARFQNIQNFTQILPTFDFLQLQLPTIILTGLSINFPLILIFLYS